jgi:hypothetical protein
MSTLPSESSIQSALKKFDRVRGKDSEKAFFDAAGGRNPKDWYIIFHDKPYPLKIIWAISHNPTKLAGRFNTNQAKAGFKKLGFDDFQASKEVAAIAIKSAIEGRRYFAEVGRLIRKPDLAKAAKKRDKWICQVCEFDGKSPPWTSAIECHHINPISGRSKDGKLTNINELITLCASCHRIVHSSDPCLLVDELKEILRQKQSVSAS